MLAERSFLCVAPFNLSLMHNAFFLSGSIRPTEIPKMLYEFSARGEYR